MQILMKKTKTKATFSSVSSIASSLSFSLPPFLRILSQNVASSSALELPATVLLQNISNASFKAYKTDKLGKKHTFFISGDKRPKEQ